MPKKTHAQEMQEIRSALDNGVIGCTSDMTTHELAVRLAQRAKGLTADKERFEELEHAVADIYLALEAASRAMFLSDRKTMRAEIAKAYRIAESKRRQWYGGRQLG